MSEQIRQLLKLLKVLDDNDFSRHLVLIGSWAEYMYMVTGLIPGYEANIRTLDVDFLVRNLRKPDPPKSLIAAVKETGFMVQEDCFSGVTRFYSGDGFEIEFLIAQKGNGEKGALKTNLGVTAQALRHMDIVGFDIKECDYLGIKFNVPSPEAFVLHKIVINGERERKAEKDRMVIDGMHPYLDMEHFNELMDRLTKNERRLVEKYIDAHWK